MHEDKSEGAQPVEAARPEGTSRRGVMAGAAAVMATAALAPATRLGHAAGGPIYIADMHFHLFFGVGRRPAHTQPLGPNMAKAQATLVSWSLVGDMPWLKPDGRSFVQKGKPGKGEATAWLTAEAKRAKAHISENGLTLVRTVDDVAAARSGKPSVVLSVEGATFADDGIESIRVAYEQGVRHIQLVHFIDTPIGDRQTASATHGGLSKYGREVVETCNRLGILIDLAHCTEATVDQVLELSRAPVVWSHSSVYSWPRIIPAFSGWKQRQLSSGAAKRIAAKGGVVGLWALGDDVGTTVDSYAERMLALANMVGEDNVAFGTDMNALARPAISTLSDLRAAVEFMRKRGLAETRLRKLAMDNYARVLSEAMKGRTA